VRFRPWLRHIAGGKHGHLIERLLAGELDLAVPLLQGHTCAPAQTAWLTATEGEA